MPRPFSRIWLFRLAAIALGLAIFPVAEGVCRVFDLGRPDEIEDPFVGFSEIHPLFVPDPQLGRYQIARSRQLFFKPDSFAEKKSPRTYRIFCLGGSTVQGRPYSTETSFTNWLKMGLSKFDKSREYEVVNCGGISYASYRLIPILKECLQYEPDLFIICTGHNEFLEDRQYNHIKSVPSWAGFLKPVSRLRMLTVIRSAVFGNRIDEHESASARSILKSEVDAILDYQNGLSFYDRDDLWKNDVIKHFESNLGLMIELSESRNIPVMVIQPCSNLKDSPPFKSLHRNNISDQEFAEFERLVDQARHHVRSDLPQAIHFFEQAVAIDDQFALVHYELGQCYEAAHRMTDAKRSFIAARENDICPLRMIEPLNQAMRRVVDRSDVMFLNADELLAVESPHGMTGDSLLVDHIHPSFRGHQLIAEEIISQLSSIQLKFDLPEDWRRQSQFIWKLYLSKLDSLYFLRGHRSLETLMRWTQGKADGPPLKSPATE